MGISNFKVYIAVFSLIFFLSVSCSRNESGTGPGVPGEKIILLSPADKWENIVRCPCLRWQAVSDAASYTLILASDPGLKNIVLVQNDSAYWVRYGTMYYPSLLDSNKTYYWKVTGYKNNKAIIESDVWSFKTSGGYYPKGNVNIKIFGNHTYLLNDSIVINKLISLQQNYGLGVSSSFYDNQTYFGREYYMMHTSAKDRLLRSQFNGKHDKILFFESYQIIRNGQAPNYTTSTDTLILKDIPFSSENDSCFVFMVNGEACKSSVNKILVKNSEYYLNNLSYSYLYQNTEWNQDSYIMIEFKK